MHQRCAMQQLERCAGGLGRGRVILAAGSGNAMAKPRSDPRPPREHGITHGGGKPGWASRNLGTGDGIVEGPFDPTGDVHDGLPRQ